jgi:DNA-binding XRE family transcriptional regulator
MTVAEQLGRNLKKMRRQAFMSQEEVSRRTGLHHTEISLLERGCRVPRLDTCIRVLESTGGDPRDLVEGIQWHESRK